MIEIYFDDTLLANEYYKGFNVEYKPFDKVFYLGSTGSMTATLTIPKVALPLSYSKIIVKIDGTYYCTMMVDNIEENDNEEYVITLSDALLYTDVEYDFSDKVPISAKDLLNDICTHFGLECDTKTFVNDDLITYSYDSTLTARQYLMWIGEIAGGYFVINEEGKLELRNYLVPSGVDVISYDEVDTFKIKSTIKIERLVYNFVGNKYESSEDTSLYTVYLDSNNIFLQGATEEQFQKISDNIIGFEFSNIKIDTTKEIFSSKNLIVFTDAEGNSYKMIPQFEADYLGAFVGSYDSSIENSKENETKVVNDAENIKRVKQELNQVDAQLKITMQDVTTQKSTLEGYDKRIEANTAKIDAKADELLLTVEGIEEDLNNKIDTSQTTLEGEVERLDGKIEVNRGDITILKNSITNTVKSIGGNNLLRNSVGFAKSLNDNNIMTLDFWESTNPQNITSVQDSSTENSTVSGSKIVFSGPGKLTQKYITSIGLQYGVSLKMRHIINGGTADKIKVTITNGIDSIEVLNTSQQTDGYPTFMQFNEFVYTAKNSEVYIVIETTGDDLIEISDLIVSQGENQSWSSYYDEVYGKEHRLDKYGLKLTDLATGDYSSQTVKAVKFMSNNEVNAEISSNQAKSSAGRFDNEITIAKLQWVKLDDENIIEYIET